MFRVQGERLFIVHSSGLESKMLTLNLEHRTLNVERLLVSVVFFEPDEGFLKTLLKFDLGLIF
jgi:hypothetical protein